MIQSLAGLSLSMAFAPLRCGAAPQAQWLSCNERPSNFVEVENSTEQWPVGKIVVIDGFVGAVTTDEYNTHVSISAKDPSKHVTVVAPVDTDASVFGDDFVRIQGLATTLHGGAEGQQPAVRLHGIHHMVYGGITSCAPVHARSRQLTDAGCGGGGQPVCSGAQLDGRPTNDAGVPVECDFGFVGGAGGICVPFGSTGGSGCGAGGQPLCAGADLDGRPTNDAGVPVECDFGFVGGARGLCVPFGASGDAPAPPASCGGGGQPVCAGADLEGRPASPDGPPVECDFGFVAGAGGLCVPFVPPGAAPAGCGGGGQPVCAGANLEGGLCVPFGTSADVPAPPMVPMDGPCGDNGQRICVGDDLDGRDPPWECNFGFVGGVGGICIPFTPAQPGRGLCGGLGEAPCRGEQLVGRTTECDEGLVARVQESNVAGVCTVISVAIALENPPPAPPPPPPSCGQGGQPECAGPELVGRTFSCDFGFVPEDGQCIPFIPDPPAECGVAGVDFGMIAVDGTAGPVLPFPIIPVASALLPSGNVLAWSGFFVDQFGINDLGSTKWTIFDPSTDTVAGEFTSMTEHDMFCPAISMLPDGRIHVAGGNNAEATSIYTDSEGWAGTAQMNIPRGYSSSVTLTNGQVFTNGGSWSGQDIIQDGCCTLKGAEVWDPATGEWRLLSNINSVEMLSDDPEGRQQQDYYGFFFAWTGASVFHAGPSTQMNWYTTEGDGGFIPAGDRGPTAQNGGAVMYEAGKILVVGGGPAFGLSLPSRTTAEVVQISAVGVAPLVRPIQGPLIPRTFSMSVVLPTGDVLHFGGNGISEQFSDDDAILQPELWNHESEQWQLLETPIQIARTYHSSGLLVPDGRVYIAGGGLCFTCFPGQSGKICDCLNNHLDAEMYSPPYLFNEDGSPATRPTVTIDQTVIGLGGIMTVTSNEPMLQVSMVRMGSSTHSVNLDQRRLELCGDTSLSCACDTTVTVVIPGDGIAIPGYWMMFAVNAAGVPSVGEIFQVL